MKGSTINDPVQWHEGMLLTPQHFQQSDLRWEQLARYYLNIGCPYYWGVVNLDIDKVLLVSGLFRINNLEAVLPDGLWTCIKPSDNLQVDLTTSVDKVGRTPTTVFLAVASYQENEPSLGGDFPRYRSVLGLPSVDNNTGVGEILIPRLQPQYQLILGDALPPRYVGIPLAKVIFEEDAYTFSRFVGPQLSVNLDMELGNMVTLLTQRIREKIAYLADKMQATSMSYTKDSVSETENIFRSLVAGLLAVEALQNSQVTHPFNLYISLCNMASHLTTVRFGQIPPTFTSYDHNDPLVSYDQILEFANRMLDTVRETYAKLLFQLSGRTFQIKLDPTWKNTEYIIGVRPPLGMSESDMATWMDSAVIATESFARSATDRRILGAQRKVIEEVESMGLMASKGVLLYSVPMDPNFMRGGEVLHVVNVSDSDTTRPYELILYV